jgi:hypothetical protein
LFPQGASTLTGEIEKPSPKHESGHGRHGDDVGFEKRSEIEL